ncbi:hypothetical protein E3N88_25416 [Mikania micrantha]|uniref:Uncharacterized protein n=1 Tax=Mikania micrantha TaxID=192012 RepID=A0A5N6N7H4_9ASTR|nr:hypothetical protein E3N88_25416 [Mikania micrantha]
MVLEAQITVAGLTKFRSTNNRLQGIRVGTLFKEMFRLQQLSRRTLNLMQTVVKRRRTQNFESDAEDHKVDMGF